MPSSTLLPPTDQWLSCLRVTMQGAQWSRWRPKNMRKYSITRIYRVTHRENLLHTNGDAKTCDNMRFCQTIGCRAMIKATSAADKKKKNQLNAKWPMCGWLLHAVWRDWCVYLHRNKKHTPSQNGCGFCSVAFIILLFPQDATVGCWCYINWTFGNRKFNYHWCRSRVRSRLRENSKMKENDIILIMKLILIGHNCTQINSKRGITRREKKKITSEKKTVVLPNWPTSSNQKHNNTILHITPKGWHLHDLSGMNYSHFKQTKFLLQ